VLSQRKSSRKDPDSEPEVFRSAGSVILSWAWFIVAAIVLVDLTVQGRDRVGLVTAAVVLLITGVVYACAWRPKIVADSGGISLINPVRDYRVPWAAVVKVDVVNAVRVHCTPAPGAARGKVLYSWAVQTTPRSAKRAALRRDAASRPRARLTPRPRSLQPPGTPPPGAPPRYGEIPDAAKEAPDGSRNGRSTPGRRPPARRARTCSPARAPASPGNHPPTRPPAQGQASPGNRARTSPPAQTRGRTRPARPPRGRRRRSSGRGGRSPP